MQSSSMVAIEYRSLLALPSSSVVFVWYPFDAQRAIVVTNPDVLVDDGGCADVDDAESGGSDRRIKGIVANATCKPLVIA